MSSASLRPSGDEGRQESVDVVVVGLARRIPAVRSERLRGQHLLDLGIGQAARP